MLDLQRLLRTDADRLPDPMAVLRAPLQYLEDEQVERALHEFDAVRHGVQYSRMSTRAHLPLGAGPPTRRICSMLCMEKVNGQRSPPHRRPAYRRGLRSSVL